MSLAATTCFDESTNGMNQPNRPELCHQVSASIAVASVCQLPNHGWAVLWPARSSALGERLWCPNLPAGLTETRVGLVDPYITCLVPLSVFLVMLVL